MAISAKDVMQLRQQTGLGMMECKQALQEADGDATRAVDLLRAKGLAKMDGRSDRAASEGRIDSAVSDDGTKGAIVQVNSETDFTAGSDVFTQMVAQLAAEALKQPAGEANVTDAMRAALDEVRLTTKENVQFNQGLVAGGEPDRRVGTYVHFTGKVGALVEVAVEGDAAVDDQLLGDLCMHVTAINPAPLAVTEDDVPADVVDKEREIAKAQAIEQGKPEQIAEKIVEGKIRKFYDDHVLPRQSFIKDDSKQIKDLLPKGVVITKFVRYQLG